MAEVEEIERVPEHSRWGIGTVPNRDGVLSYALGQEFQK